MNPTTDYSPTRKAGEGYYTLATNNADEAGVEPVWKEDKLPDY